MAVPAQIEQEVIDVLTDVSRRPIQPTPSSDLIADLGFDSLQVMETITEIEDRFDVKIAPEEVSRTRTVAQVVALVSSLVEARQQRG